MLTAALASACAVLPGAAAAASSYGVAAWGYNFSGQLGNGTTAISRVPGAIAGLSEVTAVAAGKAHSTALLANGTVMAWGNNEEGQLGGGTKATKSTVPVAVKGLSGVTAIAAGGEHGLALLSDGTVMSWGSNLARQLGMPSKFKVVKEDEEVSPCWAMAK